MRSLKLFMIITFMELDTFTPVLVSLTDCQKQSNNRNIKIKVLHNFLLFNFKLHRFLLIYFKSCKFCIHVDKAMWVSVKELKYWLFLVFTTWAKFMWVSEGKEGRGKVMSYVTSFWSDEPHDVYDLVKQMAF